MADLDLVYSLVAVGLTLLVGLPLHEFSHALAAFRLGDSTARWQGRLTLDPRVHWDPIGGTMLVLTAVLSGGRSFFGYAKPTPVNPLNLRGGRRGEALVALAGPLSNLILAAVIALPLRAIALSDDLLRTIIDVWPLAVAWNVAQYFLFVTIMLGLFNLLPVPPLDGWHVLLGVASPRLAWQLRAFAQQYAMVIPFVFLVILVFAGGRFIGPIINRVFELLVGQDVFLLPVRI